MTIWILTLVLVLSLVGLGYRQGAIRVAFSLVGIFFGVLLAVPMGGPLTFVVKMFGVKNPVVLWLVPLAIAFCLISVIFKSIAMTVHHKVEVHFRYKAGDLRFSLWERLNRRVGLCLGIINGAAYSVIISFVIYVLGYWLVQLETSEGMNLPARLVVRAAKDLQSTGFVKSARSLDRMPETYYQGADVAGLVFQNTLLEARLARYPAFLMIAERPEFQTLPTDKEFTGMRAAKNSIQQLMRYEPAQAILKNPDMLREIWSAAGPDLKDLRTYLETGVSEKYAEEPILGRWNFDPRATVAAIRRANPTITSIQMARTRRTLQQQFARTQLVMGIGGKVVVKGWGDATTSAVADPNSASTLSGTGDWDGGNGFYKLNVTVGSNELRGTAAIQGERMTVTWDKLTVAFEREY